MNVFAISYPNAIANAVASSSEAAPAVIPKLVGVIFFIVPPSSIKTKSASLLDVVVVGVSELPVVNTVPVASGKVIVLSAVGSVATTKVSESSVVAPSKDKLALFF